MERFLEAMTAEAHRQSTALRADARAEAERLRQRARMETDRQRGDALQALERKHALLEAQVRDRAAAEAARKTFAMHSGLVREVLDNVADRIMQWSREPDFAPVLLRLLQEALDMTESTDALTVRAPERHADAVHAFLQELNRHNIQTAFENAPDDGVLVETRDGSLVISNTLTQRLRQREAAASALAYRRLFQPGASQP